jgi:hypothetical protein
MLNQLEAPEGNALNLSPYHADTMIFCMDRTYHEERDALAMVRLHARPVIFFMLRFDTKLR